MIRDMAEGARFFFFLLRLIPSKLFKLGRTLPGASLAFVTREAPFANAAVSVGRVAPLRSSVRPLRPRVESR